jgi:L-asparaginase
MNGRIHAARAVTKSHTSNLDGFGSGERGALGAVDPDRIVYWRSPPPSQHFALRTDTMPYVEIVTVYGGADGQLIRAALDHGARGLIVQGLGAGNVNQAVYAAIREAIARGVAVVITSRVPQGRVLAQYGWEGGGQTLVAAGAILGNDLSAQKARILLMLLLQDGVVTPQILQAALDR